MSTSARYVPPEMTEEPWEFFITRLNGDGTETYLEGDLPLSGAEIVNVLSGADTISGTLTPEIANLRVGGEQAIVPWSTALYASYKNQIIAGGIVQNSSVTEPALSIDAAGFSDYPRGQGYDGMVRFVEVDSLDIVRHIWQHLQSQPMGNLGMVLSNLKSGVLIGSKLEEVDLETGLGEDIHYEVGPLTMSWWETDDLGKVITDMAEATPFDWKESHYWSNDGTFIHHRMSFGVPTIGRRRHDLDLVVGQNVLMPPSVERNGEEYASEVWFLGSGEGASMVRGNAQLGNITRLRRVAVASDKQVRSRFMANSKAQSELNWRTGGDDISSITMMDWTDDIPDLGDEIQVNGADEGWGSEPLWVRVLGMTRSPASGGRIELSVTRADRLVT